MERYSEKAKLHRKSFSKMFKMNYNENYSKNSESIQDTSNSTVVLSAEATGLQHFYNLILRFLESKNVLNTFED